MKHPTAVMRSTGDLQRPLSQSTRYATPVTHHLISRAALVLIREELDEILCESSVLGRQAVQMPVHSVCASQGLIVGHPAKEVVRGDLQRVRETTEVVEGRLSRSGLKMRNSGCSETSGLRQVPLSQSSLLASSAQALRKNF